MFAHRRDTFATEGLTEHPWPRRAANVLVEIPLDRYYTGYKKTVRRPDQLIQMIRLPRRPRAAQWFHKVGGRAAQAITKVGVAVVRDERDAARGHCPPLAHSRRAYSLR